jgi:hypothetical protein
MTASLSSSAQPSGEATTPKHKWGVSRREYGASTALCARCGVERVRRHAYNVHWTEYWHDGSSLKIARGTTPPCAALPSPSPSQQQDNP